VWANATKYRLENSAPIVKTTELSDAVRTPSRKLNPTAAIIAPKRLVGRRHQAYRPAPTNDHAISSPIAIVMPGSET
jgi:hypothetical protein